MKVFVTPEEFLKIQALALDVSVTRAYAELAYFVAGCCTRNGGDFSPTLGLIGVPTEVVVLWEPSIAAAPSTSNPGRARRFG